MRWLSSRYQARKGGREEGRKGGREEGRKDGLADECSFYGANGIAVNE